MYQDYFHVFQPFYGDQGHVFKKVNGKLIPTGKMERTVKRWVHPHNEYLSLWLEYGLIGMIGLYFLCRRVLKLKYKNPILGGSLLAFLVNAFGNFPLHIPNIAVVVIISYCLMVSDFTEENICVDR